jgi:hypothetical protein
MELLWPVRGREREGRWRGNDIPDPARVAQRGLSVEQRTGVG